MKIGMTIEPFKGMSLDRVMFLLKFINLKHLEVSNTIMNHVEEFTENLGKTTTTFHLPIFDRYHYDLGSEDLEYQIKITETIDFINANKEKINLKYALTHPPEGPHSTQETLIENLKRITVPILIENIKNQTEEEFMDFYFKAKKELGSKLAGFAFDAPHRFITNNKHWLKISEKLKQEIAYIHISDCSEKVDLHQPLGTALLPYKEFFEFLKEINYQGVILHETIPAIDQMDSFLESFVISAKPFSRRLYKSMKLRTSLLKPIIKWKVNRTYKHLIERGTITAKELGYDLGLQN